MQSRAMSLVEAAANVVVGYGAAIPTQVVVFPWFGLSATLGGNLMIGVCGCQCSALAISATVTPASDFGISMSIACLLVASGAAAVFVALRAVAGLVVLRVVLAIGLLPVRGGRDHRVPPTT
jgi:hypothetical protein